MLTPDLFEQLLATYPAEKRELARQVYYRFAEGDSTQFFTQLFIVLDIYALYSERVPQAVMEANQSAHASLAKVREEIGLLAQAIDKRNLNITNHAARIDELCQKTVAKCNETTARFDAILKNVGAQVDIQEIVAGVQAALETGIQEKIIFPFVSRSEELAKQVIPTLSEIREAAAEAGHLWPARVWKTAFTASLAIALTLTLFATLVIYVKFKSYFEEQTAKKIISAEQVINYNQDAFRELAIAGVPVKVMRTENHGAVDPGGFAIAIEDADGAEMRPIGDRKYGLIFFTSGRTEKQIQQIKRGTEKLTGKGKMNRVGSENQPHY
jgi:hypothetical protein